MKYSFCVVVALAFINEIYSSEADDDVSGYGYTSAPMILKRIEQLLDSLDQLRNKDLRHAPGEVRKFFNEVDYKKMYAEKIEQLEAQLRAERQMNSNQVCNRLFEEMKVNLNQVFLELPKNMDDTLVMLTGAVDLWEKKLRGMMEVINRYSAEAGDCRVADNAQCKLFTRYYKDLSNVEENIRFLVKILAELKDNLSSADAANEVTEMVANKIEKPVRNCLSRFK